jgi:hypothetical protein
MPDVTDLDGVAAAKANLIKVAGQFDPMAPVRRHPYLTAMAVVAGVAMLSVSAERLTGAASLVRWVSSMVKNAQKLIERYVQPGTQGNS